MNHEEEDMGKLFESVVISEKDVDLTDTEIVDKMREFSNGIVNFDVSLLLSYLELKNGVEIKRVSELIVEFINDAGFDAFSAFSDNLRDVIVQETMRRMSEEAGDAGDTGDTEEQGQN